MKRVNEAEAWFRELPDINEVQSKTKFPAATLAQCKMSPTSDEVISCIKKRDTLKKVDEARLEVGRQDRADAKEEKRLLGESLWKKATSRRSPALLHKFKGPEVEAVGIYKGVTWKRGAVAITKVKDRIRFLYETYPTDLPEGLPEGFNQPTNQ